MGGEDGGKARARRHHSLPLTLFRCNEDQCCQWLPEGVMMSVTGSVYPWKSTELLGIP